ncbi:MAG: hypothetical protein PHY44_09235, partial [Lachnospiraceae bacterium]|nr:hypothetical protein [Lachnospiraceae bacterium]
MYFKKVAALLLTGIMALSFTACSKNAGTSVGTSEKPVAASPAKGASDENIAKGAQLLESAKAKINDLKSYNADMGLRFEFVNNDGTKSADVKTTIESLSQPMLKHIAIDSTSKGQPIGNSQFYVKEDNLEKTIFMLFQGKWYKSPVDDDTLYYLLGQYDMKNITPVFLIASSDAVAVAEEEIDGVKTTKVEAIISAELLPKTLIYTGVFVAAGMSTLTEEYLAGVDSMTIDYWIDDDGNVIKYSFDAGAAYQTISDNLYAKVEGTQGYENAQKLVVNSYAIDVTMK